MRFITPYVPASGRHRAILRGRYAMKNKLLISLAGILAMTGALVTVMGSGLQTAAESGAENVSGVESAVEEMGEIKAAPSYDYDHLTVGTTTPLNGDFFTEMWGDMSSDLDVRTLIHGYNLIEWRDAESVFDIDPSVVSGITVTENDAGDRTYLFTIYDNLTYSDGTPITSKDYAFSMLLTMAPEVREIGGTPRKAEYIKGYDAYVGGRVPYLEGVRILNDTTISITISHEYLPFFYEMALLDCIPYPIWEVAPGCVVKDDGNGIYIANEDENVKEPVFTAELLKETILGTNGFLTHPDVTSGPYRLMSFDGTTVELEKNDNYKGNSSGNKPSIGKITFKTVDNDTMMSEFEDGSVGLLNKVVNADTLKEGMQTVQGSDVFTLGNYTRNGMSFISFCCEQEAVKSAAVRKAVSMCLDKDALVDAYVSNFGLRVDGYYGIGQWMYQLISGAMPYPVDAPADADDEAAAKEYDEKIAEWEALTLDNAAVYGLDVDGAAELLESDGWTLNEDGEEYDPSSDEIRYKDVNGELTALDLTILVPEGNRIADYLDEAFGKNLAEAGAALSVEQVPMEELMAEYYGQTERSCDMIYLATNFDIVFDPSENFRPVDDENLADTKNTTRIDDEELYNLAVDMRKTKAGDLLSYMKKWVAFEERFQEVAPMIPVYSNVYFDFYPRALHNYNISANISWGQAIVDAYMSDPADLAAESSPDSAAAGAEELVEID